MASLAPIQGSINCSLDDIDLNALKVGSLKILRYCVIISEWQTP